MKKVVNFIIQKILFSQRNNINKKFHELIINASYDPLYNIIFAQQENESKSVYQGQLQSENKAMINL